ncbi:MAG: hypothetical protein ACK53L_33560, partial [Pirellulaceae bacterium]
MKKDVITRKYKETGRNGMDVLERVRVITPTEARKMMEGADLRNYQNQQYTIYTQIGAAAWQGDAYVALPADTPLHPKLKAELIELGYT